MIDKITWDNVLSKEDKWTRLWTLEWYWSTETAEFKNCLKRRKNERFLRVEK